MLEEEAEEERAGLATAKEETGKEEREVFNTNFSSSSLAAALPSLLAACVPHPGVLSARGLPREGLTPTR